MTGRLDHAANPGRHQTAARGDDLYETPSEAVLALLEVEDLPDSIWEPACGPGAIVRVLRYWDSMFMRPISWITAVRGARAGLIFCLSSAHRMASSASSPTPIQECRSVCRPCAETRAARNYAFTVGVFGIRAAVANPG